MLEQHFGLGPACQTAEADVGACWVMFVYVPEAPLTAEQQQEIGRRLMRAHHLSDISDMHAAFVCYIDIYAKANPRTLYRIGETQVGLSGGVTAYTLTAPSFRGLQKAVVEVEAAFKQNDVFELKSGIRTKASKIPVLKPRVSQ